MHGNDWEKQVRLQFAAECGFLHRAAAGKLYRDYDDTLGMLVKMTTNPNHRTTR